MQVETKADAEKLLQKIILILSLEEGLSDVQKELLRKIVTSPRGTILRRGKAERTLWGVMPGMIVYKTKRDKRASTGVNVRDFMKWADKAEFLEVEH